VNTASRLDFAGIKASSLAAAGSLLRTWLPAGKLRGHEFQVGNLRGDAGTSLSINVRTGAWSDFATGDSGGDLIDLFAAMRGVDLGEAARGVASDLGQPAATAEVIPLTRPSPDAWVPVLPVPADAAAPPAVHFRHGAPSHIAEYRDAAGALLGVIHRFDPTGERKQIAPLTWCRGPNGREEWRWQSMPKPRPLYGLDLLAARQDDPVLVCEGEPKTDAARRLVGATWVCIAWPGGASAAQHVDWSALAGRAVAIWPDNDAPGRDAAARIAIQVRHLGGTARFVPIPEGVPAGWDVGDAEREGWDAETTLRHIAPQPDNGVQDRSPINQDERGPHHDDVEPGSDLSSPHFIAMGHDRGRFFFYSAGAGMMREFGARDLHSIGHLHELAPLGFWEREYPSRSKSESVDIRSAGTSMIQACYRAGVFDPDRLRGRGAWWDDGRAVLHLGDRLMVDGKAASLTAIGGRAIYEQARALPIAAAEPLDARHAARLMDLCCAVAWEDPGSMGRMLAGWLVIAPLCGAIQWRPHIWITSEAAAGKSWVIDNIIRPVIGAMALRVQSKTTEAGLRGMLRSDARPILFEEAETQNDADRGRMQLVLDLARQASSDDGGSIAKGTRDGGAREFRVRSCFAFASINLGLQQAADESRTVVLSLSPSTDNRRRAEDFTKLKALQGEIMTPDFGAALLARSVRLLPVIRANAEVFAQAIARTGQTRRTGDTIGVILAGTWSLRSSRMASPEEADQFIAGQAWVHDSVARAEADPEWRRALDYLMQQTLRIEAGNRRPQDVQIGELVEIASGHGGMDPIAPPLEAASVLARAGVRVRAMEQHDGETAPALLIANNSDLATRKFAGGAWAVGWQATLLRAPGAAKRAPVKFAAVTSRCIGIPLHHIVRIDDG